MSQCAHCPTAPSAPGAYNRALENQSLIKHRVKLLALDVGLDCARDWTARGPGLRTGLDSARAWTRAYGWNTRAWLGQTGGKIVVCMIAGREKFWDSPIDPFHDFPEHFPHGTNAMSSRGEVFWEVMNRVYGGCPKTVPVRLSYILLRESPPLKGMVQHQTI